MKSYTLRPDIFTLNFQCYSFRYKHGVTATTQLLSKLRESGDAADGDRAETTVSPFLEKTQVRLHVFNGLF